MPLLSSVIRTIKQRPFFIAKYLRESLLFTANYFLVKAVKGGNVSLGANAHIISAFTFQAERPDAGITVGDDFIAWDRVKIHAWGKGRIKIGDCCSVGSDTIFHCREGIEIGNHALISWNVLIADFDAHSVRMNERITEMEYTANGLWPNFSGKRTIKNPLFAPSFLTKPVIIEDGVWIGAHAIILKGSKIGKGAVIGAGAVVSGEIPPMSIAVGNPAKVVKMVR
jgi:acetyltransferase-like isoleucine patch superfamily enzyme